MGVVSGDCCTLRRDRLDCRPHRFNMRADDVDQFAERALRNISWPPCPLSRLPAPERGETRTMPAKNGLRLNDMRRTEQARPDPGHPGQEGGVTAVQSKTRRRAPQGDAELMAEEQVLGFKPARGLEEVNDEHCERIKEREHRSRSCDDSTRRSDSQAGWDF